MPRPDPKRPRENQIELFESEAARPPGKVLRGRHSNAIDSALEAARSQGLVDSVDEALLTVIRAGAWSLDSFESQNKPYGPSKIIDGMVGALREARLTPDTRAQATDDNIIELLTQIGAEDETSTHSA